MELRIIWEIICRRKWIIVQAFLVISLTAIIGTFLLPSVYKTSATVHIKTSDTESSLLASIGLKEGITVADEQEVETETFVALATVNPVIEKVISRLQLRARDGNLMKHSELTNSKFLLSNIFPEPYVEIEQVENTDLIEITARSPEREEAAMIANTLAEVYIEKNLKENKAEYGRVREFIEDRIVSVKTEYLKILEELRKFKITEKTIDLEIETKVAIDKMADLMKGKEEVIISLAEVRAKTKTLMTQLSKENETMVSSSAISENPQIELLKRILTDLELELAGVLTEKRPDHPEVIMLKQKIMRDREELKKEVDIFQKSSKDLKSLEKELSALEAHLKSIDIDIDKYLAMLYTIPDKAYTQSQLELRLSASQELYSSLLKCLYQIGIAEAITLSDIRLIEFATVPNIDKPDSPNKVLNSIVGILLGTMFGFGLALLVDYVDDTIKSSDEVKEDGLTLLGSVPKFRRKERSIISQRDPKDPISESYRTIRNSLKFASLDKSIKSLLITSSVENEGKTTSVANLGISITREGKKVLIIDTDLRRPSIHELFGVSNLIGITTILAEEAKPGEAIKETDIEGLSLLTSGPVPPDPASLVESAKMKQLIKDLGQQYDIVILDSPPALVANDAIMLAGYADISILILESGKVTRRAVSDVEELFKRANIQPVVAILNKVNIER